MPISEYSKQDQDPLVEMGDLVSGDDEVWLTQSILVHPGAPSQVVDILRNHLPVWLDLFQMKSREYGEAAFELGAKAQFVDMNRKFVKLKAGLWEDKELTTEGIDEILLDLIGHCFLTLEMRRRELNQD